LNLSEFCTTWAEQVSLFRLKFQCQERIGNYIYTGCETFLLLEFVHREMKYLSLHRITESQNHRMLRVGGDLCRSSGPTPLPKQGHLQQAAQDLVRWVLNISREGESTTSLGSLFQGSVTVREKLFFLMFRQNFLCFNLCPLPLVLSLGTTEKSLAPSS